MIAEWVMVYQQKFSDFANLSNEEYIYSFAQKTSAYNKTIQNYLKYFFLQIENFHFIADTVVIEAHIHMLLSAVKVSQH